MTKSFNFSPTTFFRFLENKPAATLFLAIVLAIFSMTTGCYYGELPPVHEDDTYWNLALWTTR